MSSKRFCSDFLKIQTCIHYAAKENIRSNETEDKSDLVPYCVKSAHAAGMAPLTISVLWWTLSPSCDIKSHCGQMMQTIVFKGSWVTIIFLSLIRSYCLMDWHLQRQERNSSAMWQHAIFLQITRIRETNRCQWFHVKYNWLSNMQLLSAESIHHWEADE